MPARFNASSKSCSGLRALRRLGVAAVLAARAKHPTLVHQFKARPVPCPRFQVENVRLMFAFPFARRSGSVAKSSA